MKYDVDYFLRKFKKIPEEKWCTFSFVNGKSRCVNGHCGITNMLANLTEESIALQKTFSVLSITSGMKIINDGLLSDDYSLKAAYINNGESDQYQQPTPKQRILAALQDIKKLQGEAIAEGNQDTKGLYPDITKELAVVEDRIETDKINVYAS